MYSPIVVLKFYLKTVFSEYSFKIYLKTVINYCSFTGGCLLYSKNTTLINILKTSPFMWNIKRLGFTIEEGFQLPQKDNQGALSEAPTLPLQKLSHYQNIPPFSLHPSTTYLNSIYIFFFEKTYLNSINRTSCLSRAWHTYSIHSLLLDAN